MIEPCKCGDACDWDYYSEPTLDWHLGALSMVKRYIICLNCKMSWIEVIHIERCESHITNIEDNRGEFDD